MRSTIGKQTPRFEHESIFFYALLGVASYGKKLERVLADCVPSQEEACGAAERSSDGDDAQGAHGSRDSRRGAHGTSGGLTQEHLALLLLGVASFRYKVLSRLNALVADGAGESSSSGRPAESAEPAVRGQARPSPATGRIQRVLR